MNARPALRTLIFTALVPGTVVGLAPYGILRLQRGDEALALGPWAPLGFALMALGPALYLPCALDFVRIGRGTPFPLDPPTTFVARGLYRWVRNPMYVGFAGTLVGEAVAFGSWWLAGWCGLMITCWHLFVVLHEEPALERRFGATYLRYRREVARWLPMPPRRRV
jgi:protein-S-isoprenylcysteine O-methyltransferase Ste14